MIKKIVGFTGVILMLSASACMSNCAGDAINETSKSSTVEASTTFGMKYINGDIDFYIYKDTQTGVEYIVYRANQYSSAICPRYNSDGEIYVNK